MHITIYLVRRCSLFPPVERSLQHELDSYFQQVLARNARWHADYTVSVQLLSQCPAAAGSGDVVVYLVQDAESSVFRRFGVSHTSGHGGLTVANIAGNSAACEVYVRTETGTLLAKTAFHEILHNKTGMGNRALHSHHRGGISAARFQVDTPVTDEDLDLMGNHLGAQHPQWTGGCSQPRGE